MVFTMVSPKNTLNAGVVASRKISFWSLPTMTAMSGFTCANTSASRPSAFLQAAWRARHTSGAICLASCSLLRASTSSSKVQVLPRNGCLFLRSASTRWPHSSGGVDSIGPCEEPIPSTIFATGLLLLARRVAALAFIHLNTRASAGKGAPSAVARLGGAPREHRLIGLAHHLRDRLALVDGCRHFGTACLDGLSPFQHVGNACGRDDHTAAPVNGDVVSRHDRNLAELDWPRAGGLVDAAARGARRAGARIDRIADLARLLDVARRPVNDCSGDARAVRGARQNPAPAGRVDARALRHDDHVVQSREIDRRGAQLA